MSLVSDCCGASDWNDSGICSYCKEHADFEDDEELDEVPLITSLEDIDYSLLDNLDFDFDTDDYPDFSDAFILSADYNGREMAYSELDILNEDAEFVDKKLREFLY